MVGVGDGLKARDNLGAGDGLRVCKDIRDVIGVEEDLIWGEGFTVEEGWTEFKAGRLLPRVTEFPKHPSSGFSQVRSSSASARAGRLY